LALSPDSIFSSWGLTVGRYVRGKEVGRFVVGSDVSTALARTRAAPSDDDSEDEDDVMEDGEDEEEVEETLVQLTLFGSTMVALSSLGTRMFIWDLPVLVKAASAGKNKVEEEEDVDPVVEGPVTPFATLSFPKGFKATTLVHPASYLNKIVIGSDAGELAVWNVRTG
jgi:U3 small nucleolar RNA-associated protein 21